MESMLDGVCVVGERRDLGRTTGLRDTEASGLCSSPTRLPLTYVLS